MTAEASSILIVDDEVLNSEGLARRLQGRGFATTAAKSGREAIELLGHTRFDLVLLDIMMPGMTGLEVLKFLRRVDSLIDLPIIMVTARGESEDIVEALELGANDYLTKPLDFPVVLARIRTQLALRHAVSQVTDLEQKLNVRNQELEETAAQLAAACERMKGDLKAAARIQQAFLPAALPEVVGARLAWSFQPSAELTGDFLNIFPLGDRHLGLGVLDVTGHGIAAALLAVTASQMLARLSSPVLPALGQRVQGASATAFVPPAEVAAALSKHLCGDAAAGQTITLLYGILGLDTREFRFVSAGHPGPIHQPLDSPPVVLEGSGFPIGVGMASYREQRVTMKPGDRLVLYADGLTETRNADGEHFGARRLLGSLEKTSHLPLSEELRTLVENADGWRGNTARHNDIAILAAEIVAEGP
jgi:sigma-B regulation protein RsbU (phosphoserine phosphatase)